MGSNTTKPLLLKAGLAASAFLVASSAALAATVQLTAAPRAVTLPDGQSVPMWGYICGDAVGPSVLPFGTASAGATCTAMNGSRQTSATWQPPLITVPVNSTLTINLVNKLTFPVSGGVNNIPTSLVIVGQLGGGLGTDSATM